MDPQHQSFQSDPKLVRVQITFDLTVQGERERPGFLRRDQSDGVGLLGEPNGRTMTGPELLTQRGLTVRGRKQAAAAIRFSWMMTAPS